MRYIEKVREFNTRFGCGSPTGLTQAADQDQLVRIQLNTEEIGELAMGMARRDLIECLDALCDIEYVVNGALVVIGGDMDLPVHQLPPSYQMHCTGPVTIPEPAVCKVLLTSLLRCCGEVSAAFTFSDPGEQAYQLNIMRAAVATCWNAFWVPEELRWMLFCEVHRSNMSKLDGDGNPVINSAGRVVKSDRYSPPNLQAVLDEYEDRF